MTLLWLLFSCLTIAGSVVYNVSFKRGSPSVNPFAFAFIAALCVLTVQSISCLIAHYGFGINLFQSAGPRTLTFGVLAGVAAAAIDLCYIMALRNGPLLATQFFWTIGSLVALTVVALLFLGEVLTATKALGVALGIAAVVLLTKAP